MGEPRLFNVAKGTQNSLDYDCCLSFAFGYFDDQRLLIKERRRT